MSRLIKMSVNTLTRIFIDLVLERLVLLNERDSLMTEHHGIYS